MSFFDAADLPRTSFYRDSSRRYRGLSYNCSYTPQTPVSRLLPPRRESAVATSLRSAKSLITRTPPSVNMTVTLKPFTAADIPSAINVHTSSLAETTSQGQKDLRTEEWNLALENPFAKIVKATEGDRLIGAAGFLTHEVNGLQWTAPERKASAGTVEKEVNEELAEARDEVLQGDYDLWHIYHVFLSPSFESSSTWSDMITWGLSQADAAGKRVYVQASSTEKRKYEKLGFELKKVEERGERYLMLRPAKV